MLEIGNKHSQIIMNIPKNQFFNFCVLNVHISLNMVIWSIHLPIAQEEMNEREYVRGSFINNILSCL